MGNLRQHANTCWQTTFAEGLRVQPSFRLHQCGTSWGLCPGLFCQVRALEGEVIGCAVIAPLNLEITLPVAPHRIHVGKESPLSQPQVSIFEQSEQPQLSQTCKAPGEKGHRTQRDEHGFVVLNPDLHRAGSATLSVGVVVLSLLTSENLILLLRIFFCFGTNLISRHLVDTVSPFLQSIVGINLDLKSASLLDDIK